MPSSLPAEFNSCNCEPCEDPVVQNIPGPAGADGAAGAAGTDGVNAFTTLTDPFTQPAVSATNTATVANSDWATVGQIVFLEGGGYYEVTAKPSSTELTLENLGYDANVVVGTIIAAASQIGPGGERGTDGAGAGTALLIANDLSDLNSAAIARTNLGLGALAVLSTVNNGNWSGTDLAVANGGTGASTAAGARTALDVQQLDTFLTSLAALGTAADKMLYTTGVNTAAETDLTAFARTLLDDATAIVARVTLGKLLPRYGLLGTISGADLNSAGDTAFTVEASRYRIDKVTLDNPSLSVTTATAGLFTAAGGGGTTLAADQSLAALTATTKFLDLTLQAVTTTDSLTAATLYFRIGTPQGAAATANVFLFGWRLD